MINLNETLIQMLLEYCKITFSHKITFNRIQNHLNLSFRLVSLEAGGLKILNILHWIRHRYTPLFSKSIRELRCKRMPPIKSTRGEYVDGRPPKSGYGRSVNVYSDQRYLVAKAEGRR